MIVCDRSRTQFLKILLGLGFILLFAVSCSNTPAPAPAENPQSSKQYYAEIEFLVEIPPKTPTAQFVYIDFLDEVTGLALNPMRINMKPVDPGHYSLSLPIPVGSLIKYRYGRESSPAAVEYTAGGNQVRYRMIYVTGPQTIQDTIFAWNDLPFEGLQGRLNGYVLDSQSNVPIPNAQVKIAGDEVLSGSDGSFLLEGLPAGTHLLTVSSLDGAYRPYQQLAIIAADATTPAELILDKLPTVRITFDTRIPAGGVAGIPLRMIGNTIGLGNTFADLGGGFSTIASRAPLMTPAADGHYQLTLELPAGMDLRYKYTLGDGFWNGELTQAGQFRIRQLIVPLKDSTITDTIDAWQIKDWAPVKFNLKVSSPLPADEKVSIQFNPYGWTEPIPMWSIGNGEWFYVLYNPLSIVDDIQYRYCRNDQCGIADELAPEDPQKRIFSPDSNPQTINDEITSWAWWKKPEQQTVIVAPKIQPKKTFVAGVEFLPRYEPAWQAYFPQSIKFARDINANWLVLTPSWTYSSVNPPVLESVPGKDPLWADLIQIGQWTTDSGAAPIIFPTSDFGSSSENWWTQAQKDPGWWQSWFDRYKTFILHHADLAQQVNARAIILGEPGIQPALPGAKGTPDLKAFLPANAESRWKDIVSEVRKRFSGQIIWAVPFRGDQFSPPAFIDADQYYILFDSDIHTADNSQASMADKIGAQLDSAIYPVIQKLKKPLLVGIDYASITNASKGCLFENEKCLPFALLDPPYTEDTAGTVDFKIQADIYNAFLSAINDRAWIGGFITRRFYPPASLQDKSSSIHGKPASDVVWFWFSQILK